MQECSLLLRLGKQELRERLVFRLQSDGGDVADDQPGAGVLQG